MSACTLYMGVQFTKFDDTSLTGRYSVVMSVFKQVNWLAVSTSREEPFSGENMKEKHIALMFLLVSLGSTHALSATYYVATDGLDTTGGGAIASPFATLRYATGVAQAGDDIIMRGGTYHNAINPIKGGASSNPVTITHYSGEEVVIEPTDYPHGAYLDKDDSHLVINGLTFINCTGDGLHLRPHTASDGPTEDVSLLNNKIIDCERNGIFLGGNDHLVQGNTIAGSGHTTTGTSSAGYHGVYVLGDENHIEQNTITGSAYLGIRMEGDNVVVTDNTVAANQTHGIGIWVDAGYSANTVEITNNRIYYNGGNGIEVNGAGGGGVPTNVTISNNIIGSHAAGIAVWQDNLGTSIYSNTLEGTFKFFTRLDSYVSSVVMSYQNEFKGCGKYERDGMKYDSLMDYQAQTGQESGSGYVAQPAGCPVWVTPVFTLVN